MNSVNSLLSALARFPGRHRPFSIYQCGVQSFFWGADEGRRGSEYRRSRTQGRRACLRGDGRQRGRLRMAIGYYNLMTSPDQGRPLTRDGTGPHSFVRVIFVSSTLYCHIDASSQTQEGPRRLPTEEAKLLLSGGSAYCKVTMT